MDVMKPLSDVRDCLLPGLWGLASKERGYEFNIEVDEDHDCLTVTGWVYRDKEKALGFAITRKSIEDDVFVQTFNPNVQALIRELKKLYPVPSVPQGGGSI